MRVTNGSDPCDEPDSDTPSAKSSSPRTPGFDWPRTWLASHPLVRVCVPALDFSTHYVLQHHLVQAEIGDQLLELGILLLELPQPPQLRRPQPGKPFLPVEERRLGDAHLATDFLHRRAELLLLQRKGDLFLSEPRPLHDMLLSPPRGSCRKTLLLFSSLFRVGIRVGSA